MTDSKLPVLYSFRRCPYAMRARLALLVSQQRCELREILLRDKAEEFLEISPKGTVPVLLLPDGRVIEESLDIMLWALERNDPEQWLAQDSASQEAMLDLIERCEMEFKVHLDRYKYSDRFEGGDTEREYQMAMEFLNELDARLTDQRWLFGNQPKLVDMAIVTFVRQFANVDRDRFHQVPFANLHRWLNSVIESELFEIVMHKYPIWKADDPVQYFG